MSSALTAQTRAEVTLTARRGESLLLILVIPLLLLVSRTQSLRPLLTSHF